MTEKDPDILSLDEIEEIERLTLRWMIFNAKRHGSRKFARLS